MNSDIIVVGGNIIGLTFALALAQQTTLSIMVVDANVFADSWDPLDYHHRVSAVALSSQRIFQSLQVWQTIKEKRVSPFTHIQVWDAVGHEIQFDSYAIAEPLLGYIIENSLMQAVLMEKIKQYPQIHYMAPVTLKAFQQCAQHLELITSDNRVFTAKLAVAADGASSWLRQQAEIAVEQYDYHQTAIVAAVKTQLPHQKIARQVFLPTGPLAFLPLIDTHLSSIVWSLPKETAEAYLALDDKGFNATLSQVFSHLDEGVLASPRYSFPLYQQQAKHYVSSRVALIGDAAHVIHPLAGQGLNMGLLDAASLAEVIAEAIKNRRNFASLSTLRAYERWRKADNSAMMTGVDVIKTFFASDKQAIQTLRGMGLTLSNKIAWIKNQFICQAVGKRLGLPKLAKY